jgi:cytochrome b561
MPRYSRLMIALHWITAALVLAAWFTAAGGRSVVQDPPVLHFTLGLAVLLLVVPRLIARLLGSAPPLDRSHGPLPRFAAAAGHLALYVFLIALPLSGWYAASRLGVPVTFLGIHLPPLAQAASGPPGVVAELHQTGGNLLLVLAGLHAAVALWHQFVLRDGTLRRMSPV